MGGAWLRALSGCATSAQPVQHALLVNPTPPRPLQHGCRCSCGKGKLWNSKLSKCDWGIGYRANGTCLEGYGTSAYSPLENCDYCLPTYTGFHCPSECGPCGYGSLCPAKCKSCPKGWAGTLGCRKCTKNDTTCLCGNFQASPCWLAVAC